MHDASAQLAGLERDGSAPAKRIKDAADWKCERCEHPHEVETGYVLTVAHMIPDKALVEDWNLAALCQRCHLHCQHKIDFLQGYMFEHTPWLAWRWDAFLEWRDAGVAAAQGPRVR